MLKRPDLSQQSLAEKDELITALFDQLDALIQKMQVMQSRIEALEGQLRKDSHNSHTLLAKPVRGRGLVCAICAYPAIHPQPHDASIGRYVAGARDQDSHGIWPLYHRKISRSAIHPSSVLWNLPRPSPNGRT